MNSHPNSGSPKSHNKMLNIDECLKQNEQLTEANLQLEHQLKLMRRRIAFLSTHAEALSKMINHQYGFKD